MTKGVSKQLLPVYDKPLIYYPLSTLISVGIREVLIITTPQDQASFRSVIGNGTQWGMNIDFAIQEEPKGLAQAFLIGEKFIGEQACSLILGDNVFYGSELDTRFWENTEKTGATIFAYQVANPSDYGVVELDSHGIPISIIEKPREPKSNLAVPGLYFFDETVVSIAKEVRPSSRGELEITSVIEAYLLRKQLRVRQLPHGTAWLDSGTFQSLHDAGSFVKIMEERQGVKIGCVEELVWRNGWISDGQLGDLANELIKSGYGLYLANLLENRSYNQRVKTL